MLELIYNRNDNLFSITLLIFKWENPVTSKPKLIAIVIASLTGVAILAGVGVGLDIVVTNSSM